MNLVPDQYGNPQYTYDYRPGALPSPDDPVTGLWRYQKLLPRPDVPSTYPLAVGGTPLRAPRRLRGRLGMPGLWLKDETTGPSASNKDRATALVLDEGLRTGVRTVTTASTGNAAIATAIGGAASGIAVVIFVPAGCDPAKTAVMTAAGAQVFEVVDGYRAAFELSRRAAAEFGWLDRNTGVNPKTVEGKKTVSFEVWEQLGRRTPDVMVLPVGDGPTLIGAAKGFRELVACGVIPRPPRIIAVQAEGCAPFAARWRGEFRDPGSWPGTAADGIAVPDPAIVDVVLDEVRHAGGTFVTVPDRQILDAVTELATDGVRSEPAGAAAYAGLRLALAMNEVDPTETAVVLVTGAELTAVPGPAVRPGRSFRIDGNLDDVARALSSVR